MCMKSGRREAVSEGWKRMWLADYSYHKWYAHTSEVDIIGPELTCGRCLNSTEFINKLGASRFIWSVRPKYSVVLYETVLRYSKKLASVSWRFSAVIPFNTSICCTHQSTSPWRSTRRSRWASPCGCWWMPHRPDWGCQWPRSSPLGPPRAVPIEAPSACLLTSRSHLVRSCRDTQWTYSTGSRSLGNRHCNKAFCNRIKHLLLEDFPVSRAFSRGTQKSSSFNNIHTQVNCLL